MAEPRPLITGNQKSPDTPKCNSYPMTKSPKWEQREQGKPGDKNHSVGKRITTCFLAFGTDAHASILRRTHPLLRDMGDYPQLTYHSLTIYKTYGKLCHLCGANTKWSNMEDFSSTVLKYLIRHSSNTISLYTSHDWDRSTAQHPLTRIHICRFHRPCLHLI